ncbi:TPA: ferrochelatase [Legionella pneumophila subsp. pneumophila]|uniref:Ferrochelatase n=2 Tax=Legionella pneumophila TaxID=446 RepID=A0AAN5TAK7_LEGPN|nr:ferrochelatase [Legionella pneumophila]HAT9089012.1 ferrochelatase [Legionella pneumophila subsp. pneumophila]TIH01309.1 ferrochelatase [Legionella pneumophila]HAT7004965.1 ferrochelatase [Legionella pneumophila]HAT7744028.1 ferrochelatase [Legionella pneumophila]
MMRRGLLLLNLGTPDNADIRAVKLYLREFLTDKRVIDLPTIPRYILVYCLILPFRSPKSAQAYQSIWTEKGSPLLYHSQNLVTKLQSALKDEYKIALGMRYGTPSITTALAELKDCHSLTILPLFPQYSSAATGSAIEKTLSYLANQEIIPSIKIIRDFYQRPEYIRAQAKIMKPYIKDNFHVLFSYHGIPERHIHKSGCDTLCPQTCTPIYDKNQACYRAQCYQTSLLLAKELQLGTHQYTTAFQSRLGKTPWIKPYTDEIFAELISKGIKNIVVSCPSFVADCLETLEEIGIRAKEQWEKLGGEQFILTPCMNDHPEWIKAIQSIVNEQF